LPVSELALQPARARAQRPRIVVRIMCSVG
jgi:hypothetical protein